MTLYYRIYEGHNVIEHWVALENLGGSCPVTIKQALSADWRPPRRERYRLTYLYGQHVKEMQIAAVILSPGKMVLESRRGVTSHQFNPWVVLDPDASATQENSEVWNAALAWSGSWKIVVETTTYGDVHCAGGVNDFDFHYRLDESARLELPAFVGVYSNQGFGGVSRSWHAYQREHVLPELPEAVRPVLYNSWEAVAFGVNERNQLVLNLAREDVRDWVCETLDTLLSEYIIEFIKWDMNRHVSEPGWPDEANRNPERIWLDHVYHLYEIIDELRLRHPNVALVI